MEVDANRVYTWANQPGLEFFGSDVLGREAAFYFEGEQDTYDRVRPLFQGDEQTFYVESWQRRRDGERRLLAWWCRVLKDEAGNVTGALSTARDVTEERRALAEICEGEERFRNFFDSAPIGKSMTGPDGKLLRVNPALCCMLGYSAEELQSTTFSAITHPDDIAESMEHMRALLAGERDTWTTQKRYVRKDGRVVWAHLTTSLQRGSDGTPLYLLTHVLDITERMRAAEEKASLQAQLVQAQKMEAVGQLAGGIAHDFNNILGAIIMQLQMLRLQPDVAPDELHQAVDELLDSADRAAGLTRQLLLFSQPASHEDLPARRERHRR